MYSTMARPREAAKKNSKENNTGIPTQLKEQLEETSGFSFDDVMVHYNSSKPAQLSALAFTQGNQVYMGPGQEKHLPHELGHVAQQKQGIVRPTDFIDGLPVNDDPSLEGEADMLGHDVFSQRGMPEPASHNTFPSNPATQFYMERNGYVKSAIGGNNKRNIMTNSKQPATVYIESTSNAPNEFTRLGITEKETVPDPWNYNPDEQPLVATQYKKYAQDRIPYIERQPPEGSQADVTVVQPEQGMRTEAEREKASQRLNEQSIFLTSLIEAIRQIRAALTDETILNVRIGNLKQLLTSEDSESLAIAALGKDIQFAAFAMGATDGVATNEDKRRLADMALEELEFRIAQVQKELELVDYKPILKTHCDTSSDSRALLMDTPSSEKAQFDKKGAFGDEGLIGWTYHYATKINVSALTDDALHIEDAAGKSLSGSEKANAHWFARLYGVREADQPINITGEDIKWISLVPQNRFNAMSAPVREAFFEKHAHLPKIPVGAEINQPKDNVWELSYASTQQAFRDSGRNVTLTVFPTDGNEIKYEFKITNGFADGVMRPEAAAEMDFLRGTADAVVESLIMNYFAQKTFDSLKEAHLVEKESIGSVDKQLLRYFIAGTSYSLEDLEELEDEEPGGGSCLPKLLGIAALPSALLLGFGIYKLIS